MYIVMEDNNIVQIKILGPGRNKNRVRVFTILSPEDEMKSMWGQITYEVHTKELIDTLEAAEKAAFIGKLS